MQQIREGDIVTRRSYGGDIYFRVEAIEHGQECAYAELHGLCHRLCADAPLGDLERKDPVEIDVQCREHNRQCDQVIMMTMKNQKRDYQLRVQNSKKHEKSFFRLPGRVLHLDGEEGFTSTCHQEYLRLGVPCRVMHVKVPMQPDVVVDYLREDRPDILVLTGHDKLKKNADICDMSSYKYSEYYVKAVRKAREFEPSLDDLIIIAGGCFSFFEALIEAGANFASSPKRVLIEVLDPLLIAQELAFTSIGKTVPPSDFVKEALKATKGNSDMIGGVQTRGKLRLGNPRTQCPSCKG